MQDFFCQPCIAAMPAAKFWLVFLAITGISLASLLAAKSNFLKARLIEDMPTSRIRSASQGYVELAGLAISREERLTAPLTGDPCLWWRYRIERYQKTGKSSSWSTVDRGVSTQPFFMDDRSGICRIEPTGAEISCLHRRVWYGSSRLPATSILNVKPGFLNRLQPLWGSGRYRYTEFTIKEGDPLYLLGHFVSDSDGRKILSIDQITAQLIRHWKQNFNDLLQRFDHDGDGALDNKEWQGVREAAAEEALQNQQTVAGDDADHVVTKPEDSGLPFLIGSHGQEHLSRRFRWRALGSAAAFLGAGSLATWLISSRLLF